MADIHIWGTTRPSRNYTLTRGTTTWPLWNYVVALRHHHVTLVELRPDLEAPPWTLNSRFMELGPITEAPPWTPPRKAHIIMSIWWGTTTSPTTRVMGMDGKNTRVRGYPRIKSTTDSYYPRVAGILIPAYKWVGYGYHTIRTRGYPLPAKN